MSSPTSYLGNEDDATLFGVAAPDPGGLLVIPIVGIARGLGLMTAPTGISPCRSTVTGVGDGEGEERYGEDTAT